MKITISRVAVAVVSVIALASGSYKYFTAPGEKHSRVFRIGYGSDRPLHFADEKGEPSGLAVGLVREAARRRGVRLEWVSPAGQGLDLMTRGVVDMWVLMTDLPERRRLVHFTEPYLETEYSFMVLADSPYRKSGDLGKARISSAGFGIHRLRLGALLPGARLLATGSPGRAFEALIDGQADAAFLDQYATGDLALSGGSGRHLRLISAAVPKGYLGLASRFEVSGAADEIRDEMRQMAAEGKLAPYFEGWGFFPGLNLEAMDVLSRARSRERLLLGGLVALVALLIGTVALILNLQQQGARLQKVDKELRDSEERFRSLSDASLEGIVIHEKGTILDANPTAAQLFGYSRPEELIGACCVETLLARESRAGIEERIRARQTGIVEVNALRKDGTVFPAETETRELKYRGREARLVAWRDITERRQSLTALRDSEERYKALFDRSLDCVFLSDFEGRFLDANQAALDLLGYTKDDIGKVTYGAMLSTEQLNGALGNTRQILSSDFQPGRTEYRVRRKNGGHVDVEIHSSVIYRSGKPFAVQGIARDVTSRKRAEEERTELQAKLHQSSKMESIGRLAGGVAHDFNNLLTVILGYSNKLLTRTGRDHPFRWELGQIVSAAEKAAGLTRQLLTFSRQNTGTPRVISIDETIAGIEPMLRRLIEENVEVILAKKAPEGYVYADPGLVEQVIVNLAVNGRDAMPEGGQLFIETARVSVTDEFSAATFSVPQGNYVSVAVTDTGVGMTKEVEARLFEPFFTTKDPGKGTGLGLSTVYGIVKQTGGLIKVHSTAGIGTSLRVFFPAVSERPTYENVPAVQAECGGDETILLVEDESGVRNYVREELVEHGYCVLDAANGAQAMELALRYRDPIHILLTDMVLPGMNGLELIREFRAVRPHVPVLRMSGYPERFGAHLSDGSPHLQKPFTAEELLNRVRTMLDEAGDARRVRV